ncbi:tetratricopeptide repeat protein [Mucilaginibacter terrigena]|uniref:Tetratricopeptide repeat protein n=1 Tax=Mucilaginibacter terrigena TaxID=2492395 RepID=A0A4Q5LPM9_9SPHI|nr:tetratricopeptide repeat protein [Mucilaginibacter terrigena]RYU91342.1 tetratricopeptide repeat protein [Mucilaginibacter terrigena]
MNAEDPALSLFIDAVKMAEMNRFIDAINKFTEITHQYPDNHLADDAMFNAGLCHFHINSFNVAINMFRAVIANYPEATVYTYGNNKEFGKTAAKCHYAIINCYLGLAQPENAADELQKLSNYTDSYIESPIGEKIAFFDLAKTAIDTFSNLR